MTQHQSSLSQACHLSRALIKELTADSPEHSIKSFI